MTQKNPTPNPILDKQKRLETMRLTLKQEFVGIDAIIDSVIQSISAWYVFPHAYQRPLLINLWGLTGIGKTSLVKRLSDLMELEKRYLRFNLSESEDDYYKIKFSLYQITKGPNIQPMIIALDEFQNFRTVDDMGRDTEKKKSQAIWDLIDSGKIQYSEVSHAVYEYRELLTKLKYCLANGVVVKNGKIVEKPEFYLRVMDQSTYSSEDKKRTKVKPGELWFIPLSFDVSLADESMSVFNEPLLVRDHLKKLNGPQSTDFIQSLIDDLLKPKTIDCSSALIFILGNLDEAYTMSNNFNPDMNADEFYEESSRISLTQIKNALKHRFRNEQIARLGNNHLIYPSLSSADYKAFIGLELKRLSEGILKLSSVQSSFTPSVYDLIYSEGVFPTQGCRPVLSTIYQLLHSKLGLIHYTVQSLSGNVAHVRIDFNSPDLVFQFSDKDGQVLSTKKETLRLNMAELRKEPRDETQAITAVHETGHALLSMVLLNTIPEYVYSVTADSEAGGFTLSKADRKYHSKIQLRSRLAVMLGGHAAEKLIFGADYVTSGAESDIQRATQLASYSIKALGFGSVLGNYQVKAFNTNLELFDEGDSIQQEIAGLLKEAETLASRELNQQKPLLLALANILQDHGMLKKQAIEQLLKQHSPEVYARIQVLSKNNYYRNTLNKQINEMSKGINSFEKDTAQTLSLNIDKTKN